MRKLILALLLAAFFSVSASAQLAQSVRGTITTAGADCAVATNCVGLDLPIPAGAVSIQLIGAFNATVQFEASADTVTFVALNMTPRPYAAGVTSATAAGTWVGTATGIARVRARASAFVAGPLTVQIRYSPAPSGTVLLAAGGDPQDVNLKQWAGVALGAPANFGTTPGAVIAGSENASLFVGTTAVTAAIVGAPDVNAKGWGGTALGAPANFGTTPGAVVAGSVNSSLFVGTTVVTAAIAGAPDVNAKGWGGTALGAPTNFGTTPGAVVAGSVNASLFVGTTATPTGTGASGAGIPRVTVSNDSSLAANQSVNVNQINGAAVGSEVTASGALAENTAFWLKTASALYAIDTAAVAGSQQVPLKVVSTAIPNLKTDASSWAGTVLGAPTNFGTTPGAVVAGSVNASLFVGTTATPTGTGASGAGVPRVTVSNDSSLAANQSVNMAQVGGTNTVTGGVAGSQGVGGLAASGVAVAGNPVLVGGTDGVNARTLGIDSSGRPAVALAATAADAQGNTGGATALVNNSGGSGALWVWPFAFNGTTWDRWRSASLSNFPTSATLTARNSIGASLQEKGSRWSVISNPAAGSQATASIAAEASVRHVADCISFSAAATTAPALTALTINLRDGASGAGTVIWTYQTVITVGTGQEVAPHSVCGLNLVGTTNTALTLEFSASLANLIEAVSLSGFNVN